MHLVTVLAFAFLFWRVELTQPWLLVSDDDVAWSVGLAVGQPLIWMLLMLGASVRVRRLLSRSKGSPTAAQQFYHRAVLAIRVLILAGLGVSVFFTRWTDLLAFGRFHPLLQIVGDLLTLSPFFVSVILVWVAAFPLEKKLRADFGVWMPGQGEGSREWRLGSFLDFNVRHHIMIVAVPMMLILFTADLTRSYDKALRELFQWRWAPDVVLGAVAVVIFIASPVLLRRIWRTASLEAGPMRDRLEAVCTRIGLKCRDILIWHSDGLMINAAVMGLFAPVRYVMLSDALLETMQEKQIEAVFGHEAGHVKHRHIQHFLLFALVGWLVVAGVMEAIAAAWIEPNGTLTTAGWTVQGIGIAVSVVIWGLGFGWVSRRFERQADLYGARCVAPDGATCDLPCSVHVEGNASSPMDGRVCATGAAVFASALDRVAVLNGIPHEERSWRHSSIGSRIRFLTSLAGDPGRARRFERTVGRVKVLIVVLSVLGSTAAMCYGVLGPEPALVRIQTVIR